MKRSLAVLLHVFALSVQAKFGIDDETTLEKLKLPWGTYEASPYKGDEQVSTVITEGNEAGAFLRKLLLRTAI